eukprot:10705298-Heterocapsa_arctica.AAC.1
MVPSVGAQVRRVSRGAGRLVAPLALSRGGARGARSSGIPGWALGGPAESSNPEGMLRELPEGGRPGREGPGQPRAADSRALRRRGRGDAHGR